MKQIVKTLLFSIAAMMVVISFAGCQSTEEVRKGAIVSDTEIITYQMHFDAFSFLGNENVITKSSDFGQIWGEFFNKGGYDPIRPYAEDTQPINVWYTNSQGEEIYSQGLFVKDVDKVPEGYTLVEFPASDYLVVTTGWLATPEEATGDTGNGRCNRYAETVEAPEGYVRNDVTGSPITKIEKENTYTSEGHRYEVWIPIKKVD